MLIRSLSRSLAIVCVTGFLTACSSVGSYGGAEDSGYGSSTNEVTDSNKEEVSETFTISIKNFAFEPAVLTVSPGDTLIFVNEDTAPHTATAKTGVFDTGNLGAGESGSVVIADVGTYEYFCSVHPTMTGRVVVQ